MRKLLKDMFRMVMLQQALLLCLAFAIMTAASWGLANHNVKQGLRELFVDNFHHEVAEMRQILHAKTSNDAPLNAASIDENTLVEFDLISPGLWGVRDPGGSHAGSFKADVFNTLGLREIAREDLLLPISDLRTEDFLYADDPVPLWLVSVNQEIEGRFAVATPIYALAQFELAIPRTMGIAGIAIILITLMAGFLFGLRFHARLARMAQGLRQVANGDLSVRIARDQSNDDLDDLAISFDQTTTRLETLMGQLNNMSRNIAHDLKTPLARLRSRLETTATQCKQSEDEIFGAISDIDSIILIFDTISRISKIEAGAGKAKFTATDLGDVVRSVGENFGPVIEDSGYSFSIEIEQPLTIHGDARMLGQALANFVQNAIRYAQESSHITLFVRKGSIGVENEGTGIPEEDRERVLRPMVRLDQARQTEGSGLGLSMARAIAQLHDADLILDHLHTTHPNGLIASIAFESVEPE